VWLGFLWGAQGGRPSPKPAPSVQSAPRNTESVARLVTARKTDPTAWSHEPERRGCEEGQAVKRGPPVSEWCQGDARGSGWWMEVASARGKMAHGARVSGPRKGNSAHQTFSCFLFLIFLIFLSYFKFKCSNQI
jgi:hypothetical protein